ncbi:FHA domain-containing protein [Nocardioides zeae]
MTIGRDQASSLVLAHGDISRRHCELHHDGASWWLTDLGSTNGTLVDGQRIASLPWRPGRRSTSWSAATAGWPCRCRWRRPPAPRRAPARPVLRR